MSDVKDWFTEASANSAGAPNGWPEGMLRSEVNNSGRETQASVKRFYDAPDFRSPFEDYTLIRSSGTVWNLQDGTNESNASALLKVGQRIKMNSGTGADSGKSWEGWVTVVNAYSAPNSSFTVEWIAAESTDTSGPVTTTVTIEVGMRDIGKAAWYGTGASSGNVPLFEDLDPHVIIAESSLNVGQLDSQTRDQINESLLHGRMNMNGAFDIWQRGTSFTGTTSLTNSDGNVCADGWTIISDGNDRVDIIRSTDVPTEFRYSARMEQVGASNEKHGLLNCVEADDCRFVAAPGASQRISASFYAKFDNTAAGISTVRAYLLNLKNREPGTHPVAAWPAGSGSDATINSLDWEIIASAQVTLTSSWQRFTPSEFEDVDPDISSSGGEGLAIMFHVDQATIAVGARWFLGGVQINEGGKNLPFHHRSIAEELSLSYRYCEKTFDYDTQPDDNTGFADSIGGVSSGANVIADWRFKMTKFKAPNVIYFNPNDAAAGANYWEDDASVARAVFGEDITSEGLLVYCTSATDARIHRIAAYVHANIYGNN